MTPERLRSGWKGRFSWQRKKRKTSVYLTYSEEEKKELEALNAGYRDFLSRCKTERESVQEAVHQAEAAGYRDLAGSSRAASASSRATKSMPST
jgi:hypothetical protein